MIDYAPLAFLEGIPYSPGFDDIYHTRDGGTGQIEQVFMAGNGLPQRWQNRETFCILETGFGLGLSFLVTWQAWRQDPLRSQQLHFVSVEKYPFQHADLLRLHQQWPELKALSCQMLEQWPPLQEGKHELLLDEGRVRLTLLLGDALLQFPQINLQADAIYLDGFAPAKNPAMWSLPLLSELARLAAPQASLASWCVAGQVRRDLQSAGFEVRKATGFGGKRHMLTGKRQMQNPIE